MRTTLLLLPLLAAPLAAQLPEEVRLQVQDGPVITGDLYRHPDLAPDAPAILLFHQGGGDARGEYADILPRLAAERFHLLAVDVRGGGSRFGGTHRVPAAEGFGYCDAYDDVQTAVSMARANGLVGPLIAWGSSYTATLVVQLGARRTADIRAVLAFSPARGEPMRGCEPAPFAEQLARAGVPLLAMRATSELATIEENRAQLEHLATTGARTFIAQGAGHGSSVLVATRFQGNVAPQWDVVLDFLRAARAPRSTDPATETVTVPSDDWRLHGELRRPGPRGADTPLVLMLHKAAGHRAEYETLADALAARGIASLRLDLRGHGESTNRGRFIPYVNRTGIEDAHRDVTAALAAMRALPGIDAGRLAVVSASYSGEAAARALREEGERLRAAVALSPGSFSEASFAALDATAEHWLLVRGDAERFVGDWLDEGVRAHSRTAELWVLTTGAAHATNLMLADPQLPGRLADWLAGRLR